MNEEIGQGSIMDQNIPPPTPPNSYVEVLIPLPQNVTVFGGMVFKEIIRLK